MYLAFNKNYDIPVRVARYHNVYGPFGSWRGGREKVPAAICRKVATAKNNDFIDVWGDGSQTRSFLYIDDCIEATRRMMQSDFTGPVNIGSEEMVTIDKLVDIVSSVSGKVVNKMHNLDAPVGVRGRNSDNKLIKEKLGRDYTTTLEEGLRKTYKWIEKKVNE